MEMDVIDFNREFGSFLWHYVDETEQPKIYREHNLLRENIKKKIAEIDYKGLCELIDGISLKYYLGKKTIAHIINEIYAGLHNDESDEYIKLIDTLSKEFSELCKNDNVSMQTVSESSKDIKVRPNGRYDVYSELMYVYLVLREPYKAYKTKGIVDKLRVSIARFISLSDFMGYSIDSIIKMSRGDKEKQIQDIMKRYNFVIYLCEGKGDNEGNNHLEFYSLKNGRNTKVIIHKDMWEFKWDDHHNDLHLSFAFEIPMSTLDVVQRELPGNKILITDNLSQKELTIDDTERLLETFNLFNKIFNEILETTDTKRLYH